MELQQGYNQKASERKKTVRKKLYVFLFCFIASSMIWLIIKLSGEYTEIRSFPMSFINIPHGKVLVTDCDSLLTVTLKSSGFRLLVNSMFFDPSAVTVDVTAMMHQSGKSSGAYYVLTNEMLQSISKQISYQNQVLSIEPDTLFISLLDEYSKKVPVKAMLDISYAQQYGSSDTVSVYPDSVTVSGPKKIIDTITFMPTVSKVISNISSEQKFSINFLGAGKNNLTVVPETASVYIPVEKFTESSIEVVVEVSREEQAKTFPEKATIKFHVPLSKYKEVRADMFKVTADISKAKAANLKKVKLEVIEKPSFIKVIKIEPDKIEYLLLK